MKKKATQPETTLTLEGHRRLAQSLILAAEVLEAAYHQVGLIYAREPKPVRHAAQAITAVNQLRQDMETILSREQGPYLLQNRIPPIYLPPEPHYDPAREAPYNQPAPGVVIDNFERASVPCPNCGTFREVSGGVMAECSCCGDDETDLTMPGDVP